MPQFDMFLYIADSDCCEQINCPLSGEIMKRAIWLQETRLMRFEEAYEDWTSGITPINPVHIRKRINETNMRFKNS